MEELIPTLQEEGEERIDTLAEQTIIAGVQTINGKAGDLDLKTINNTDLLTPGNINLATPTDIHNLDTAKQDKLVAGTNIQIAADGKTISATDTTYSAGSGLNLTGTTFSVDTDTIATQNDIYTLQTTKQDNLTTTQLNAVNSGIDSTKVAQIATNEGDIATINGKIPTQASTSNQLADKNFVNSSVQTATANYRGSWDDWASVPTQASDYPEDYAGSHTPTVNDYMVVQDASDYTEETLEGTWRFKYTGEWDTNGKAGWLPEYQVNETPLTAAQIAAINSGITDTLVAQISTNQSNISDLSTNKLDKNTTFWGQSVQNGAVQGTLTLTESGQNATIATSGHNTADAGIKMGNSKNYVEAGVTEITLSSTTGGIKLKPKSGSSVDVMSSKITNLATPTANTDASTKKYVDDGLAAKQNTLTAGANIAITGDEISATDTTYTAGAGLTLTGTEFSVNDPAPSGFWTGNATESGTGTSITINNALATTPKDIKLDGDTEQISYTGKNLSDFASVSFINANDSTTTRSGLVYTTVTTTDKWGECVFNQTAISLQPNTTYTFSALVESTTVQTGSTVFIDKAMSSTGNSIVGSLATGGQRCSVTFTTPNSIPSNASVRLLPYATNSTAVYTDLQIEAGSTATTYEPYVGGVPSPNPDYPQDIQVVTGRQTVDVVGKNRLDFKQFLADRSVSYTEGTDGALTFTLANALNQDKLVFSDEDISVSIQALITNITSTNAYIELYNKSGSRVARLSDTNATAENISACSMAMNWQSSGSVTVKNAQIELGSTATAYEPYQGGSYEINLGKNLLDSSTNGWGYITSGGAVDGTTSKQNVLSDYIAVSPDTTYTLSVGNITSGQTTRLNFAFFTTDKTFISRDGQSSGSSTYRSTTTPTNCGYMRVFIYKSPDWTDEEAGSAEFQLELGSTATTYSAYFTPIELCKIGTYQDYIYKTNGNWYKHAEVGKEVYDNASSFTLRNTSTAGTKTYAIGTPFAYEISSSATGSSNCFTFLGIVNGVTAMYNASYYLDKLGFTLYYNPTNPTASSVYFNSNKTTAEILAEQNIIFYYQLATPTDMQITNAELIAELEALADAQLATGQNTITSSGVSPNLDAILTIEAFNNNWNGLSQALLGA